MRKNSYILVNMTVIVSGLRLNINIFETLDGAQ